MALWHLTQETHFFKTTTKYIVSQSIWDADFSFTTYYDDFIKFETILVVKGQKSNVVNVDEVYIFGKLLVSRFPF